MMRSVTCGVALSATAMLLLQGCGGGGGGGPPGGDTTRPPTTTSTTTTLSAGPSGLYWCEEIASYYKITYGADGTKSAAGQCIPSTVPGAYYTKAGDKGADGKSDKPWECFSPDFEKDLWTDKAAQAQGYSGACLFRDFHNSKTPDDVDDCAKHLDHHPALCAPGPSMFWGACYSSHSENWRCIPKESPNIPGLAKGDCKAGVLPETGSSTPTKYFYDGACRFGKDTTPTYKCDTISSYEKSRGLTCGQDVDKMADKACFSVKSGVQWVCSDKGTPFPAAPCDWTVQPDGSKDFYRAACLFPRNDGYDKALDGHNLTATVRQEMVV